MTKVVAANCKVVAANWKMHHGPLAARRFFRSFRPDAAPESVRILVFPPDVSLGASVGAAGAAHASSGPDRLATPVELGVQNVHWESGGAFTGETSAEMAWGAGATLALVGHSERRHLFGETDEETGRKATAAVRAGLVPVACVGERLEERRAGRLQEVLARQLAALAEALAEAVPRLGFMVAYEPVWAIGTGETATPADVAEAHAIVRAALVDAVGRGALDAPVLYGGSVAPGNAAALMASPGVDGVLVGGASLDPASFAQIVEAASGLAAEASGPPEPATEAR